MTFGFPTKDEIAEEINELLNDRLSFKTQMVLREKLTLLQLMQMRDELLPATLEENKDLYVEDKDDDLY